MLFADTFHHKYLQVVLSKLIFPWIKKKVLIICTKESNFIQAIFSNENLTVILINNQYLIPFSLRSLQIIMFTSWRLIQRNLGILKCKCYKTWIKMKSFTNHGIKWIFNQLQRISVIRKDQRIHQNFPNLIKLILPEILKVKGIIPKKLINKLEK